MNPLHIPREPPLTPLQVAIAILLGLTIIGLLAFAAIQLAAVVRLGGWVWGPRG